MLSRRALIAGIPAFAMAAEAKPARPKPIVIAHRGASGARPEHTLASYQLGIDQGADFIEPDLVSTKDGVLVARHENEISETTNVAEKREFLGRKTAKVIDGQRFEGWFTEDFTLAELKTLRARERLPQLRPQNIPYNDRFEIPTFAEVLDLAAKQARPVGVYPETKHPSYHEGLGLAHDGPLLAELKRFSGPVFIQSFEVGNLKRLKSLTKTPLIQLMASSGGPADGGRYADMATPEGLRAIARYAFGIGPEKAMIIPRDGQGRLTQPTSLVADAHKAGLKLHPWTFRAERFFLPADVADGVVEIRRFLATGIDGLFADFPDQAVAAIKAA
jgi:glycerophosphoryl diester phosphodiesterase